MKKIFTLALLIALIPLSYYTFLYNKEKTCNELRYSFDIGTGAMKSRIGLVDKCNNKILKIFAKSERPTRFEQCMVINAIGENEITEECMKRVIGEFKQLENDYNMSCLTEKCAGVATAWARKAANSDKMIEMFKANGLHLKKIPQETEGVLSFEAVRSSHLLDGIDDTKLVVWDIGGGSFQFTTLDQNGKVHVYNGPHGIESFEKEIRRVFNLSADSAFPFFSNEVLDRVINYAANSYGKPMQDEALIAAKLQDPEVIVVAVGGPFVKGFKEQMDMPQDLTLDDLSYELMMFENKTAQDVAIQYPKLPESYRVTAQSSLILIKAIMIGAVINKVKIMPVGLSDYVLIDKEEWE
ncbi:MAG: hypothetical protein ACK5WS_01345 [Alphaproteobacteria bacterium]|nr:hypothetical protein [Candidatus Jidaibacter sp.]